MKIGKTINTSRRKIVSDEVENKKKIMDTSTQTFIAHVGDDAFCGLSHRNAF